MKNTWHQDFTAKGGRGRVDVNDLFMPPNRFSHIALLCPASANLPYSMLSNKREISRIIMKFDHV